MMIISGTKIFKREKGVTTNKYYCENCKTESHWHLMNLWSWFTFFFIPIFPYYRKKVLVCPVCNYGIKVTKKNRDEILEQIESTTSFEE